MPICVCACVICMDGSVEYVCIMGKVYMKPLLPARHSVGTLTILRSRPPTAVVLPVVIVVVVVVVVGCNNVEYKWVLAFIRTHTCTHSHIFNIAKIHIKSL